MMDKLPQAIYILRDLKLIYMNEAAFKLLDLPVEELHENPKAAEILASLTEKVMGGFRNIATAGITLHQFLGKGENLPENASKSMCFQYSDPSTSTEKRLEARLQKINFDSKESLACTIDDLTVSMELERQLLNKRFEKIFMASFTHELVTPVNGMIGVLDIIQSDSSISHDVKRMIETAKANCKLLLYLTNDVIEIAKEAQGKVGEEWFSIKDALAESTELYDFGFCQKQISLDVELSPEVPLLICTDRTRYRQVLVHLLGNALKYTMVGSVTIQINYCGTEGTLITSVRDTGVGMSRSRIENLFKLFGNLDSGCHLNPQGIGLGLSICKRHAEILGGKITVESAKGKGSIFTLTIPVKTAAISAALRTSDNLRAGLLLSPSKKKLPEKKAITLRRKRLMTEECPVEQNIQAAGDIRVLMREDAAPNQKNEESKVEPISLAELQHAEPQLETVPGSPVRQIEEIKCQCKRFLVVDDNELNRFVIQGLLKGLGMSGDEVRVFCFCFIIFCKEGAAQTGYHAQKIGI